MNFKLTIQNYIGYILPWSPTSDSNTLQVIVGTPYYKEITMDYKSKILPDVLYKSDPSHVFVGTLRLCRDQK